MKKFIIQTLFIVLFIFSTQVVLAQCTFPDVLCSDDFPSDHCGGGKSVICHKRGCAPPGTTKVDCPWGVDSGCEPCVDPPSPPPGGGPISCSLTEGGEYGFCSAEADLGYGPHCSARCFSEWSIPHTDPDVECHSVGCSPCYNPSLQSCCRRRITVTPTTAPPPGGPTNPPAPTSTPISTPTPRPTATSTPIPTRTPTATPRPTATRTPTPTKGFAPVGVPTTAPRQTTGTGESTQNMTWRCLKAEATARSNYGVTRLKGEGFPTDIEIDIVSCVQGGDTFHCTTGVPARDTDLGISPISGHIFKLMPVGRKNPIKLTTGGNIDIEVESRTSQVTTHVFYGVYRSNFELYPGEDPTIKFKSFDFSQDYAVCVAIRWDPYGRVFDSQSLEPMPGINIIISDKNRKNINLPGIANPVTTNLAGFFNFYIEPGEYYLEPESVEGYTFSASPSLNPNYNKIYSNIYKPDEPIYEVAGTAQHRDIALDPGINQPLKNSPREISFNILPGYDTTKTRIIGEVSHPLTRVELYQDKTKIGETVADKFGYYEISIDTSKIKQEIPIIPKLTKVDVYNQPANSPMINNKNIFARLLNYLIKIFKPRSTKADPPRSVTGSSLMPRPHYLEGFVYDTNKQIAANTMVEVVVTMSDRVYYQTQTDDSGVLIIIPDNLPIFDYYLKISPSNGLPFTMTTGEFIQLNKDYLNANQINLINATKNSLPVVQ